MNNPFWWGTEPINLLNIKTINFQMCMNNQNNYQFTHCRQSHADCIIAMSVKPLDRELFSSPEYRKDLAEFEEACYNVFGTLFGPPDDHLFENGKLPDINKLHPPNPGDNGKWVKAKHFNCNTKTFGHFVCTQCSSHWYSKYATKGHYRTCNKCNAKSRAFVLWKPA